MAVLATVVVGLGCVRGSEPDVETGPPNIVLVSIDTLRPDHLSCYGYPRPTSPVIDRLASEGVLFANHISSSSWTLPAHAALFTALEDSVHGCTDTDRVLGPDAVTLAEALADHGYLTAGFFSGPYLHPVFGLAQGFETYGDCTSYGALLEDEAVDQWAMDPGIMRRSHRDVTNPIVTGEVLSWLASARQPFFLFVHMWDVHFDFIPPPPYDSLFDPDYQGWVTGEDFFFDPRIHRGMAARDLAHLVALYDGEIRWTDEHLGRIVARLEDGDLLDRTVVVITGDHGTEFFEHGDKGHRKTLFDEVIRVPLVVRFPPALPAGVRVQAQTRAVDVAPTILALAGVRDQRLGSGPSLVELVNTGARHTLPAVSELFSVGRSLRAVRTPRWKVIHDLEQRAVLAFDLSLDPAERRPQARLDQGGWPARLATCRDVTEALAARTGELPASARSGELPTEVLEQLRALGYAEN